jgi:micrococcal nuclease
VSSTLLLACLVIGVQDGDSIKVTCPARANAFSVRLAGIDAPEIAHKAFHIAEQPGGRESKAALTALCLKQPATIHTRSLDRYKRTLAVVECNGVNVNGEQVRTGNAWAYIAPKRWKFTALQAKAQADGIGLWAQPNPIKPSVWRKGAR